MQAPYVAAALVWWLRPWLIVVSVATLIACTTQDAMLRKTAEVAAATPDYDSERIHEGDVANRRFIPNNDDDTVKNSVIGSSVFTSPTTTDYSLSGLP